MKRIVSVFLVVLMALAAMPAGLASVLPKDQHENVMSADAPINPDALRTDDSPKREPVDENEIVTLIVKLKDSPVAARVEDVNSAKASDISAVLKQKQGRVEDKIRSMLPSGVKMEVVFRYSLLFNGIAVKLPRSMMDKIAELPEVEKVYVSPQFSMPELVEIEPEKLDNSVHYINADAAWAAGYTGKGTVIAVIDTGCILAHDAFSTDPEDPKFDENYLANVFANNDLQAESLYLDGELTADAVYYSAKIPFRFNYDSHTTDVSHSYAQSDHGSHVAGIAAGYYVGSIYTGVAKDAQLVVMQVFNTSGGAEWSSILAALEDCVYLEVDAVNLSIGTDIGFSSENEEIDAVMDLMAQRGINIAGAAGNGGTTKAQYHGSEYEYALTMNPDNGLVSAPGTYTHPLSVAMCRKTTAGFELHYYSSHGSTPDLKLKPEITAPGLDIIAPVDDSEYSGSTTGYDKKSGTSMSCPHITGAMALLTNYVSATWPSLTGLEKSDMVNRLIMCTATPISGWSPRAQGSGVIDVEKAITTEAYITVEGCSRPKLELGDDPQKTGVYTLSFEVVNFGSNILSYTPIVNVFSGDAESGTLHDQDVYTIKPLAKEITSSCSFTGNSSFSVPANSTKIISITVSLNSSIKDELNSKFANGSFIDGYVVLDGAVDLVVPFLSFFGNWCKASVFDRYTYIDEIQGVNHFNVHSVQTQIGAKKNETEYMLFGANPYISSSDWWADRCTLSPNNDANYDKIDKVVYALIRNAKNGGLEIYNEEDPTTVYYYKDLSYMPKSWHYINQEGDLMYYHSSDWIEFAGWTPPSDLPEGTHIVFRLYHYLDYEGFDPADNECCEIVLPMTIDTTAPEITYWKVENGTLDLFVHDSHYAAWIGIYEDEACTALIAQQAIAETERGAYTGLTFDIGESDTVYAKVGDYGYNTSEVYTLTGESGTPASIDMTSMTLDPGVMSIYVGEAGTVKVNTVPSYANNFEMTWSSNKPEIAAVSGSQKTATINAVSAGTAIITATAVNPDTNEMFTATINVTVTEFNGYIRTDSVEVGEHYIIVADSSVSGSNAFAVGNTTVTSSQYLAPVSVTLTDDDRIELDPAKDFDTITWIPSGNAESGYSWRNVGNNKYIGINSGVLVPLSSSSTVWSYEADRGFLNSTAARYLIYSSHGDAKYTLGKNTAPIRLYKLVQATYVPATYTVTFVDYDGSQLSVQSVTEGEAAIAPDDPSREGYTFTGWDKDFSFVTEDITVTAQYSINSYTVTFVDWEGTVLKTETVEYGSAATPPDDPTRAGYTFTGWDGDFSFISCDITFTAQYEPSVTVTLRGDVDCNGTVNALDALMAMRYAMSLIALDEQSIANGDMDCNGSLTATDAVLIMRLILSDHESN